MKHELIAIGHCMAFNNEQRCTAYGSQLSKGPEFTNVKQFKQEN